MSSLPLVLTFVLVIFTFKLWSLLEFRYHLRFVVLKNAPLELRSRNIVCSFGRVALPQTTIRMINIAATKCVQHSKVRVRWHLPMSTTVLLCAVNCECSAGNRTHTPPSTAYAYQSNSSSSSKKNPSRRCARPVLGSLFLIRTTLWYATITHLCYTLNTIVTGCRHK